MNRRWIVEPRGIARARVRLLVPLLSVFAALILAAIFLQLTGNPPLDVYGKMVDAAFGSSRGISETLISSTPLILTGVAAAVAFRMLVWNIGGEGQLLVGAVAAAGVGFTLGESTPAWMAVALVVIGGALGGAFWASLSAVPRVYLGTNGRGIFFGEQSESH